MIKSDPHALQAASKLSGRARSECRAPLRIAQIVPIWARVPPVDYGGTELRVWWLTEELVKRGHEVTLFASGDSKTSARLRSVYPHNLLDAVKEGSVWNYAHYANALLAEAIKDSDSFDLIHCHTDLEHISFTILSKIPVIYSLRTALSADDHWLLQRYPEIVFVAMSHAQIKDVPNPRRQHIPVIHNGCNFGDYELARAPGTYLAYLGRMGRHKNPLAAIQIARASNMPIVLAGNPQEKTEQAYFEREIRPLIDGTNVRYIGPVDQAQKQAFLQGAAALLFPIQWEEPFGNVMIEAMASGTPVLAYNRGSVAEVIDPGITGFHANSAEELISLVPQALALDRARVRNHAQRRFCHMRMVDEYVQLYQTLVDQAPGVIGQAEASERL